ncbi:MAG: hypothetical protein CMD92_00665 [Gammaproteobacteria bacterium]|nr:hypothetical protein [Gammaproteobacteria bacterium]
MICIVQHRVARQLTMASMLMLGFPAPEIASAQDAAADGSTVVYTASYFAEWQPITAGDMLARIPGQDTNGRGSGGSGFSPGNFSGSPSRGGRGLGSGAGSTEILINGKRNAGKNNSTQQMLQRIASSQVQEIQIIRATSGDLDVRGSGQIINVVLLEELSSTSFSYQGSLNYSQDDAVQLGGTFAVNGQRGALDYTMTMRSQPRYRNSLNNESSILGDFSPNDTVIEEVTVDGGNNEFSFNLAYTINSKSTLQLNGLFAERDAPTDINRITTNLRSATVSRLVERETNPNPRNNWESGFDYEYTFSNGARFKLLGIANQDDNLRIRRRFQRFGNETEELNLTLKSRSITEELIIRSSYTFDFLQNQSLEIGGERAQTTLDSALALGLLHAPGTPSAALGGLVPVNLGLANSQVEEIRYEPFAIHNWIINPKLTLESTLLFETSEIVQTGDALNSRKFDFIKPKIDLRYNITPMFQIRGSVERIVNQLSFADFVAANDEQDNDANTLNGNAELRQQAQWRYTLNSEYRLPNDVGVVSAEFFYADHQDVIDWIDASTSDNNLASVNGNLGDGVEFGANITASIRMAMIGRPNLLVNSRLEVQDSEVTDPFDGRRRRFRNYQRGRFTLTTRHDIPKWRFNWGTQYFDRLDGGMFQYDIRDFEFTVGEPFYGVFAEIRDSRGITYRLDVRQLTDGSQCRERWRYEGRRSEGLLRELEYRCTHGGTQPSLTITGNF